MSRFGELPCSLRLGKIQAMSAKDYVLSGTAPTESAPVPNHVWAFDLGKGSIGEAVRVGANFKHKASLLIPGDFAETRTARDRRRMWRTRQAHHAREQWLREVFQAAGLPVLYGRNYDAKTGEWKPGELGDPRLEREFPPMGEATCHTSCQLRIKLLRGEKLEPWQVFKAFHSAIQRRGYDPNIPWKTREARRTKEGDTEDDETGTEQRMRDFEKSLHEMAPAQSDCHFPAYFDAWKMGLWNPAQPVGLKLRVDCHAESTRNQIVPRRLVEAEIRRMVDGAAKHYPALAGKADYLLFGPAQKRYASYNANPNKPPFLREGAATDWQGVVGQKIPRFDNRIIAKCAVIPRLNVCKLREGEKGQPHPQSLVAVEVAFLMKLKNLRFQRGNQQAALSVGEIRAILEDPKRTKWAITESAWRKYCQRIGAVPLPGHDGVESPRLSGRSRFCRPALEILKRLIVSGQKPSEFLREELARLNGNKDPRKGLVESDLKFLREMADRNDTWESLYIPNQQLDALAQSSADPDEAIQRLIGQQNDPVVRHRLDTFAKRLKALDVHGRPDHVVLEFVREDFMGKKAKLELSKFMRDRAEERKKAREEAANFGATEKSAGLKLELLRAQGRQCLYNKGEAMIEEKLDEYEIEHIVPRSRGGPDAVFNYVLTTHATNKEKGDRTPYEWFHQDRPGEWDAYVSRVRSRSLALRNKKVQLLISPNAEELAGRYTALAETAWIAKLAQTIVGLHFGWRNGVDYSGPQAIKRVLVVSGGLTGRIRRRYGLNRILNPNAADEEEAEKKNRNDDRHHALDAMVISFLNPQKVEPKLPDGVHREFFAKEIADVMPQNLCYEKPALAETIYGARGAEAERVIVLRVELFKLAMKGIAPGKTKFDLGYLAAQIKAVRDGHIQRKLAEFHATSPDEAKWKAFCDNFHLAGKNGSPGSLVRRVLMNVGEPTEYKDLSKDGTGAFRKALKGHRGQIVYVETSTDKKGKAKETVQVRPIYAFESPALVRRQLREELGDRCRIVDFFQSGCLIEVTKQVPHTKLPLPPGRYLLNTIRTGSKDVKVTTSEGKTHPEIPRYNLAEMVAAGLQRVD